MPTYRLAETPLTVVEARGCTQVAAYLPFTALPGKGRAGRLYAVVEVLEVIADAATAAGDDVDVPWHDALVLT